MWVKNGITEFVIFTMYLAAVLILNSFVKTWHFVENIYFEEKL